VLELRHLDNASSGNMNISSTARWGRRPIRVLECIFSWVSQPESIIARGGGVGVVVYLDEPC